MKNIIKHIPAGLLCSALVMNTALANDQSASDRYIYGGLELGLSEPVVKQFDHTDKESRKTKIRLKQSHMVGGKIGYSFYPNMVIEISGTHQPKYNLAYTLPETPIKSIPIPGLAIPKTPGRTRVSANVYTLNLIYMLENAKFLGIKPYVIGGAGIAMVNVRPAISKWNSGIPGIGEVEYFRINKTKTNAPAYQVGFGFAKEVGSNIEFDISAKLQVVQNIKIKYDTIDLAKQKFVAAAPIKKTIGVSEFAVGIVYKFPI